MRIGIGYDIHKLVLGRDLILGGVKIPHTKGLLGHSDADVLIHAIIDSLLGALALGDIGTHFSDKDNAYKDINSQILLKKTVEIMEEEGYKIVNIDSNIICQKPKLMGHIEKMKETLAPILKIEQSALSIKAKTNEELDSMGQENSISAQAV